MRPLTSEKCDKAKQRWLEVVLVALKACMRKSRSSSCSFLVTVNTMRRLLQSGMRLERGLRFYEGMYMGS